MSHCDRLTERSVDIVRRFSAGLLAIALTLFCLANTALSAQVANLYTAQVAWDAQKSSNRNDAYRRALDVVLLRITGADARTDADLAGLFERPSALVSGYRRGPNETLWVSFDGREIQARLRAANRRVWGSERPLTVVWLAVDHGRGDRQLVAASDRGGQGANARRANPADYLRERTEAAATRYGIPLVFPLLDASERASVTVADVRGGFAEPILEASQRYGASSVLIGNSSSRGAERIDWVWHFGGDTQRFTASVEAATSRVASDMASLLAIGDSSEVLAVRLEISNIFSVAAYGSTLNFLSALPQVNEVHIAAMDNGVLDIDLTAVGAMSQLKRALGSGALLQEQSDMFEPPTETFGSDSPRIIRFRYAR